VLVATSLQVSLPWLILAMGGTRLVMTAVNLGYIVREMPWLRPRLSLASRGTMRALAGTSAALLLFQLSSLLINEAQVLIVAQRLGLAKVAEYSIFVSVHILPIIFISTLDGPLMPAFREAHVRGDASWLRSAFFRITKIKMAIAVAAAGLYLVLGNFAARLLSHGTVHFGPWVWAASGLLLVVGVWNGSFVDLMIATNRLWFLVALVMINAVGTAGLTYWFSGPGWFPGAKEDSGIFGVVLATPLFSIFLTGWLLPWACRDLIRKRREPPPSLASGVAK
jgi:O-antigen/teichoic acid export membrane protein